MLKILHYYWCWIAIFHCWASRVSYVQFSVVDGVTWIFPPTPRFLQFFEEKVSCNGLSACVWFLHANFSCKIRCPCKTMVLTYSSMYKRGWFDWLRYKYSYRSDWAKVERATIGRLRPRTIWSRAVKSWELQRDRLRERPKHVTSPWVSCGWCPCSSSLWPISKLKPSWSILTPIIISS